MSESFPYFRLSKYHNVPYATVLLYADAFEKKFENLNYWEKRATQIMQGTIVGVAILKQCRNENVRRKEFDFGPGLKGYM
jgi:hypothetical protein